MDSRYPILKPEDELRLLKISVERSSDEVFWLDFDGNILYVNDAACEITGYSRDELFAMKIAELDPEMPPGAWEASVADLRERQTQFITSRHRCRDGRFIDVDILAVYVNHGDHEFSFAFVRDVTERRKSEEELRAAYQQLSGAEEELHQQYNELVRGEQKIRESEENYRAVVTWAKDGIVILQDGMFRFINPKAAEMMGGTAEELAGSPFIRAVHPREQARVEDFYKRRMRGEAVPPVYETTIVKLNGDAVDIELNAGVIIYSGKPADLVYLRDITERKRSQKALEQAKKKLSLLNYVTFNDTQNLIFTLSGYQELAKSMLSSSESPLLPLLEKEENLVEKITDSLKFARTYQDLGLKAAQWQNVSHAFLLAISHLDFLKIRHSITTGDLEIYADPLFEQVFQILADNTLVHGRTAGKVNIGFVQGTDGVLTVFYEDDGVGIPEEVKEKIFLPEFQKKKSVGLFLAREILEITEIALSETGIAGKGARFEIRVPKGAYRFTGS
jgi:PAS domain S-box-containing protein